MVESDFTHAQISDDEDAKEDDLILLCEKLDINYEDAIAAIRPSKLKS